MKISSSIASSILENNIIQYQKSLPPVSADSDESGISDTEVPDIPLNQDSDYQEFLSSTINSPSPPTSTILFPSQKGIILPPPPARPSHFRCNPAWHWDDFHSPINSDCEERALADSEDSEEGAIPESSILKKRRTKKKKGKSPASKKYREEKRAEHRKAKTKESLKNTVVVEAEEGVNLHALRRRSRGHQPPSFLERSPLQIQEGNYYWFTLAQVQNGLIIRDSKQRPLVHLFPLSTISKELLEILANSFQEYENSVTFANNNYAQKRGDYEVRILGCWFKSGRFLQPYMTAHYRGPKSGIHYKRLDNPHYIAAKKFQKANHNLFQLVENLIQQHYPDIWEIYSNIKVPSGCHKFAGLFAAVVINKLVRTKIHKDLGDIKCGICVIIC